MLNLCKEKTEQIANSIGYCYYGFGKNLTTNSNNNLK